MRIPEMRLSITALVCALLAGTNLTGCTPHAVVLDGDENAVDVGYSGDLDAAMPIATRHCAGFGRAAKLAGHTMDTAYFDCVAQ
jgi:hypothetical protein